MASLFEPTASSQALLGWVERLRAADASGQRADVGVFVAALPPLVSAARERDFRAAGLEVDASPDGLSAHDIVDVAARAQLSPAGRHQAMFAANLGVLMGGAALWLDGQPVAVPRFDDGSSRLGDRGHWLGERFFCVPVGGLYDHPLHGPPNLQALGRLYGVLVCDLARGVQQLVLPRADQAWTAPVVVSDGQQLVLYGSPADRAAGLEGWRWPVPA
jgi:hypothetical protein